MTTLIEYKKAGLKYERLEEFEAGLELFGYEVKALKSKMGQLDGSRVVVRGGEAYLVGVTIPPYQAANTPADYDPARTRRLLLNKGQIAQMAEAEAKKGLTIVPIEIYNKQIGKRALVKVRVAIVRGKGKFDKRQDLKKKDADREAGRLLKQR